MPHLLLAGKLHRSGRAIVENTPGVTFDYVEAVSEESYAPLIARADGLVLRTQPMTERTIDMAERLKVVSRHGVGYDAVDVEALSRRGIALTVVGDVNSVSVAEHAMMLLLACAKRALRADAATRDPQKWDWRNKLEATELDGKNLLIMGYGRIGRRFARLAMAFGMNVRAYDPYLQEIGWPEGGVLPVFEIGEGLQWADAVSTNMPRAEKAAIGAEEIGRMKPGVILINTARGGIIDEVALADGLRSGQVGAAGLDVLVEEPPKADNPLSGFDQLVLSPHIAGLTAEAGERMAVSSVRNVLDYLSGTIDRSLIVNGPALKMPNK